MEGQCKKTKIIINNNLGEFLINCANFIINQFPVIYSSFILDYSSTLWNL